MALSASIIWEVRTGGSDLNGGGFKPGASGVDYSQQNSPQYALTGVTSAGAGDTVLTASAATDMVGNVGLVNSGTNFTLTGAFFEVLSVVAGVSITFGTNNNGASICTGVGSAGAINIGGALASPGLAAFAKAPGNDVFIKSGTYAITSATPNVSGGCVDDPTGGNGASDMSRWVGYNTHRVWGNTDTPPLLQASGAISSFTILKVNAAQAIEYYNIATDCASKTSSLGIALSNSYSRVVRCSAVNATGTYGIGMLGGNSIALILCEASGCSGTAGIYADAAGLIVGGVSHGNTCSGFRGTPFAVFVACLSYANSGAGSDGFSGSSVNSSYYACDAYNNGRYGFALDSNLALGSYLFSCLAEGNASDGFYADGVSDGTFLFNCGGYNNGGNGNYNASFMINVPGFVAGSASFFTNPGSGDFSLNSTAGGGAAARAAGFPGLFPAGLTTSYADIGAAQHQASGSSGGLLVHPGMSGGMRG